MSTLDLERFELRLLSDGARQGVALVCLVCEQVVVGGPADPLGTGDPGDNTLDRLSFLAGDHAALYCAPNPG